MELKVFFFFSSRRRHTRLQGDWSSDVCSSDLSYFVRHWSAIPQIFASHFWAGHADWKMYYRPLINLTYLVEYHLWGLRPLGYHLTNVVTHLAVCLLVLWICSMLLRDWLLSFTAALAFAVHPVHSQS